MLSKKARRRFAELIFRLRTEARSPREQAASIGFGVFVGCTPLWGLHLVLVIVGAKLLGLSRVTAYLAANIGNPLTLPFLVYAEVQTGALLRRGSVYPFSVEALAQMRAWDFAAELLLGSVVVGAALGFVLGFAAWLAVPKSDAARVRRQRIEKAAFPFLDVGIAHWEFARGKLAHDPVYLHVASSGMLPKEGRLLDLGCGRALVFALLKSLEDADPESREGRDARPRLAFHGIEGRRRTAAAARRVLGDRARIRHAELATVSLPGASAALLFDVLHYMPLEEQLKLLERVSTSLEPGGLLLVREADAEAGVGYSVTLWAERLRAWGRGDFRARFHFLPARVLRTLLEERGFEVRVDDMGRGTPFANVLLAATKRHEQEEASERAQA